MSMTRLVGVLPSVRVVDSGSTRKRNLAQTLRLCLYCDYVHLPGAKVEAKNWVLIFRSRKLLTG